MRERYFIESCPQGTRPQMANIAKRYHGTWIDADTMFGKAYLDEAGEVVAEAHDDITLLDSISSDATVEDVVQGNQTRLMGRVGRARRTGRASQHLQALQAKGVQSTDRTTTVVAKMFRTSGFPAILPDR